MKKNLGTLDKVIRLILAAFFIYLYFSGTLTGVIGIILLILAGIFIMTSLVSFCPFYSLIGVNTSKKQA